MIEPSEQEPDLDPEFRIGDSVIISGDVSRSGEPAVVVRLRPEPREILYAVRFQDGTTADLSGKNLELLLKVNQASK